MPVRIFTSYHPVQARLIESRLKEAGVNFKMQLGGSGVGVIQTGGPFEFWVEDETTARDPEVKAVLKSALSSGPLTPEEEDAVEAMEFKDEPTEYGYAAYLVFFILGIGGVFLLMKVLLWLIDLFRTG